MLSGMPAVMEEDPGKISGKPNLRNVLGATLEEKLTITNDLGVKFTNGFYKQWI